MNKKGFTLIELIGTITILAIIMAIAIPNVISITRKNKNQTYINDARKMVTLAKYEFESNANITRPNGTPSGCVVIQLKNLDQSELQKGPESGTYDGDESFVKIIYDTTKKTYAYSVQIIEEYSGNRKGLKLTSYDEIVKLDAKNKITTTGFTSSTATGCNTIVEK